MTISRRTFLATAASAAVFVSGTVAAEPKRFFTVGKRNGRWFFNTPRDEPFFSIALNHIDSSALRQPETIHIWRTKYDNSMKKWLSEAVGPDLKAWGFNSVGWVQEVVAAERPHSHNFTFEEYQWLGLPYCHLLPFTELHQWEGQTRNPDFFSKNFEEWCDHVARAECGRFADDPNLIGYFYVDCPTWVHDRPPNHWRGPLFDPKKLETEAGRKELSRLATKYYKITHDAVRRYDKNHLILGDRYEAKAPLPVEILEAAKPYVDVLSFQHFGKPPEVKADLERFHKLTGKPVLYADGCAQSTLPDGSKRHQPEGYAALLKALCEVDSCVGLHLCGAYIKNRYRRRGLRNEDEKPDAEAIEGITKANRDAAKWMEQVR